MHCLYCIGKLTAKHPSNLHQFPIYGLDRFVEECKQRGIEEISFTGTDTDPLLYRHPEKLISWLREKIPGVRLSLHTNGLLILRKRRIVELFDRLSISLYSFESESYNKLTGVRRMPDFVAISQSIAIPTKVSVIYSQENHTEIASIMEMCRKAHIKRFVLRKVYGFPGLENPFADLPVQYTFAGNPVYTIDGLEVTWWDFAKSELSCINLFADGSISEEYNITKEPRL
ncbi:MAG: radical SAM protein [Spirochaetota bacterium]